MDDEERWWWSWWWVIHTNQNQPLKAAFLLIFSIRMCTYHRFGHRTSTSGDHTAFPHNATNSGGKRLSSLPHTLCYRAYIIPLSSTPADDAKALITFSLRRRESHPNRRLPRPLFQVYLIPHELIRMILVACDQNI